MSDIDSLLSQFQTARRKKTLDRTIRATGGGASVLGGMDPGRAMQIWGAPPPEASGLTPAQKAYYLDRLATLKQQNAKDAAEAQKELAEIEERKGKQSSEFRLKKMEILTDLMKRVTEVTTQELGEQGRVAGQKVSASETLAKVGLARDADRLAQFSKGLSNENAAKINAFTSVDAAGEFNDDELGQLADALANEQDPNQRYKMAELAAEKMGLPGPEQLYAHLQGRAEVAGENDPYGSMLNAGATKLQESISELDVTLDEGEKFNRTIENTIKEMDRQGPGSGGKIWSKNFKMMFEETKAMFPGVFDEMDPLKGIEVEGKAEVEGEIPAEEDSPREASPEGEMGAPSPKSNEPLSEEERLMDLLESDTPADPVIALKQQIMKDKVFQDFKTQWALQADIADPNAVDPDMAFRAFLKVKRQDLHANRQKLRAATARMKDTGFKPKEEAPPPPASQDLASSTPPTPQEKQLAGVDELLNQNAYDKRWKRTSLAPPTT